MPEGDTVYRAARRLDAALAGSTLISSDVRVPEFATVQLAGQLVHGVLSRGKHLLMRVGDTTIHSHLKMEGAWLIYSPGERWRRPAHEARIILNTEKAQAVGFALGVLELLPTSEEDSVVGYLGPDLLGPDWDAREALSRLEAQGDRPIGIALLDQRIMAGLGNVYRSEICFLRGILPTRPTSETPDLPAWIDLSRRTLAANRDRQERTFTGNTRPGQQKWVYGRAGKPCRRCGTTIKMEWLGDPIVSGRGSTDRQVYWCPNCQH
ncbi:DNA-formamidopyrimidine glycosylase family protein [Naasia lichenicola]|uniref:DNA-(apurinic or apyrimidinic site) lyase n=1 Tax=Naasia lichenicola TaxID=2565933 RepID=A0A4S4FH75_9MICO|nr:DNA-formamidopyrimidine glycosylase family protein [Naasia lichenicola]THG29633.1 Fpg/Nei family DNA glycosylase [Naasia lichenicola]